MIRVSTAVWCVLLLLAIPLACFGHVESVWISSPRVADPGCNITSSSFSYSWRSNPDILSGSASAEAERWGCNPVTGQDVPLALSVTVRACATCLEAGPWGGYYGCSKIKTISGHGDVWVSTSCSVEHNYDSNDSCSANGAYARCNDL